MDLNGKQWGFLVFRIALGVNLLIHGAVRIFGDYGGFVDGLNKYFEPTIIAGGLVTAFATVLPWIEVLLGVLLLVGFQTKWALVATGLVMSVLIFGMSLVQNWDAVGIQMIYVISVFLLLTNIESNRICIDKNS